MPAGGLLKKDATLKDISQQESRYDTGTTPVQNSTIRNVNEKAIRSSIAKKGMLDENPSPVSCGTGLRESRGTQQGHTFHPEYLLHTVRKDNTGKRKQCFEICAVDATRVVKKDTTAVGFGLQM